MEQYLIVPWDTRSGSEPAPVDWDMQVPPEIDAIAELVMKQYDMTVSSRTLITSKPDKGGAIWRIETNKGPRSLKLLHRTPERSLFSVGLQEYVVQQGARVPALIPAKDGKLFVEMGGKLWIVTDWIALTPASKVDLVGAQELCYGLGEFHRHSKGYMPPFGAKNSSRLYRWTNYYQKIAKKIGWMREMAKAYRDTVASASILAVVDQYERQAIESLERLKASAYPRMVAMGEPYWGLVHQDYGWSNGQNGPGGLWVIDLDGVSYDLPFRDLRKLITSTMDDMGVWDTTWMRGMIEAYHQANPLDAESFEVLLIDMAVPNEFYKHLKEMFFDPITFLNTEAEAILQRVVATDQSKAQALADLAKDMSKYKPGSYEPKPVAVGPTRVPSETKTWDQKSWGLQPQPKQTRESVASAVSEENTESMAGAVSKEKKAESFRVVKKKAKQETKQEVRATDKNGKKEKQEQEAQSVVKPAKRMAVEVSDRKKEEKEKAVSPHKAGGRKGTASNVVQLQSSGKGPSNKAKQTVAPAKKKAATVAKSKPRVWKKSGAGASKAVAKPAALPKTKRKAVKPAVKKTAKQTPKVAPRVPSAGNKTKRAAQSKSKHSFTKVAAPSKKMNNAVSRKPNAKKGVKTKGVR
ncbi:CotS family spore coat protein [Brevibacillus nitrificans]|uniref:CotS family spore coat protein n=1 Tax=Brevibacillus nitrificans TaxID=651560 RepID=UPI0028660AF6|nr:CotS family spore coat protein [Brevibacillus nitrificans]MDR7317302.1 CotS family spore coat protein [Brevibacillus nitrificans]